ncbi:cbb3-type cytochrome oxidase subunit 3 [Pseudomonas rubra]|uniref:Cbb3-type cytochrome c oxidase subunit 3 n=1 Tax=Pseudomonas rubra TaxID=2942627 RepID=A0ABT5P8V6_9PSED|nr:CcoQ/FixQ family Cbb3-type cytochrome c oxidase assembly chaperone [Pseudomonas rubra]MDD1014601.1 cbb3-type cytochrome c oxidase subunit 3 [Pseudomonas rubra]MDD1040550.1 cbb3-type cytochrome c oxidase subunit 3 [Pseudomonas rubra]MDD1153606.1 cbb3-type cytochrome c oxidase subunit 3 [Pseudomonas rubra]
MDFTLDIGQVRGLGTLLVAIAFIGLSLWVFSGRRNREFAEASLLPFADERLAPVANEPEPRSNGQ